MKKFLLWMCLIGGILMFASLMYLELHESDKIFFGFGSMIIVLLSLFLLGDKNEKDQILP